MMQTILFGLGIWGIYELVMFAPVAVIAMSFTIFAFATQPTIWGKHANADFAGFCAIIAILSFLAFCSALVKVIWFS